MNLEELPIKKELPEEMEPKIEGKVFRLCRKKYFLTYSQCGVSRQHMLDFLLNKFPVENYVISQEFHEDGNQHLHVYLSFKKQYNVRNPRVFDYVDSSGKVFHPNIEAVKSSVATLKYVTKFDKDFVTNLEMDSNGNMLTMNEKLKELVEKEGVKNALRFFAKNYPDKVLTSFTSVKTNLTNYANFLDSTKEDESINFYDVNSFVRNAETERIVNWWETWHFKNLFLSSYGHVEKIKGLHRFQRC